jgi:hypothetical protein
VHNLLKRRRILPQPNPSIRLRHAEARSHRSGFFIFKPFAGFIRPGVYGNPRILKTEHPDLIAKKLETIRVYDESGDHGGFQGPYEEFGTSLFSEIL